MTEEYVHGATRAPRERVYSLPKIQAILRALSATGVKTTHENGVSGFGEVVSILENRVQEGKIVSLSDVLNQQQSELLLSAFLMSGENTSGFTSEQLEVHGFELIAYRQSSDNEAVENTLQIMVGALLFN